MIRTFGLAVFALAGAAAPALAASPIEGLWQTESEGAQVEIFPCGANECGRIVTSELLKANPEAKDVRNKDASLRNRPLKGLVFFQTVSGDGKTWKIDKLYNAADGNTYTGKVTLDGANTLKLQGCVVFPLCKTQTWTRVR